jgi:hypothetical protein
MAAIIKDYIVEWAPYSATPPTTGWNELKHSIRSMPNVFPDPDTVDVTTIDMSSRATIPGMSGGDALGFTVAVNLEFLTAHEEMFTEQIDPLKGYFWIRITMTNRRQRISIPATTVENLPTPEGEAGSVDEVTWNVYTHHDPVVESMV